MEIELFRASITEADINGLITKWLPDDVPVRNLQARITPEGISISGKHRKWPIPFKMEVGLSACDGKARVQFKKARAAWVISLRKNLLESIQEKVKNTTGICVMDDALDFDLETLLNQTGVVGRTNLSALKMENGRLLVEASC